MRTMGRIITSVTIENLLSRDKRIHCDALVDTGASHMTLPLAWRDRLGELEEARRIRLEMADQTTLEGVVCGPVRLQITGFEPVFSEVIFVDMVPDDGDYEPLIGYIPLEQSQAAVDMLGHRLVHVKRLDLK
ncbi:MAG: hypothetical protein GHCLOJNM_01525 [bacterium]|nr:hypothetical protein [bacterium]